MATRDNITHGPATIAVAALGTTLPTSKANADAIVAGTFSGFTSVGRTSSPVTFRDSAERKQVRSTQSARPEAILRTGVTTQISTTLLEVTADRLAEATAAVATTVSGTTTLNPAGIGPETEYALVLVGPYGRTGTAMLVAERAASMTELELAYGREDETTVAVSWEVLNGDTIPAGWRLYLYDAAEVEPEPEA